MVRSQRERMKRCDLAPSSAPDSVTSSMQGRPEAGLLGQEGVRNGGTRAIVTGGVCDGGMRRACGARGMHDGGTGMCAMVGQECVRWWDRGVGDDEWDRGVHGGGTGVYMVVGHGCGASVCMTVGWTGMCMRQGGMRLWLPLSSE